MEMHCIPQPCFFSLIADADAISWKLTMTMRLDASAAGSQTLLLSGDLPLRRPRRPSLPPSAGDGRGILHEIKAQVIQSREPSKQSVEITLLEPMMMKSVVHDDSRRVGREFSNKDALRPLHQRA